MKIVVVGGHGLAGSKIVDHLGEQGHDVVSASRRTGVDAVAADGLAEALDGAEVVVDACNSPSFADDAVMEFFTTSTRNILAAGQAAGVGHHLALSVVGCDRLVGSGYMRAKVAQEQLVTVGPLPYTIVRATQFFTFIPAIADAATAGDTVRLPSARFQPVATEDLARSVDAIAMGSAVNGIVEVGGPEPFRIDALIRQALSARHDPRRVVVDPDARYFGAELAPGSLMPGELAQLGEMRFADWLGSPAASHS
ncbi:MAG TPA: SDR family oxidoreductase [Solirubrobacteraceae bacterium]|nr:SDR family oxidoreductase [Solirubrobacteraceae bacterium]